MNKALTAPAAVGLLLAGCLGSSPGPLTPPGVHAIRRSVVKIYVTIQRDDYLTPWQGGRAASASGSGFIIQGRRILTNAHIVSDVRFLEIQKDSDPRRFKARVRYIGHDCDLALLEVEDPAFFQDTLAVEFAETIPDLNDEVTVLGYPTGGDRLSITRGVLSRIDYNVYTHSGVDQHLVFQVDAAINPGNSGGPVIFEGRVIGLAFQGIAYAQNIGYAIPIPVIRHFLKDIADDKYHGYPELGVAFLETRNEALRRHLKLPPGESGVAIINVDPFGSAKGHLRNGDILLSIDGYAIAHDGTIELAGNRVIFHELIERKQWGETVRFEILRDGVRADIHMPLANPQDPFVYRNLYNEPPRYYITGGLVFTPLSRKYLEAMDLSRRGGDVNTLQLLYYSQYAKIDNLYANIDEFVVFARQLPHPVNTYATDFVNGIVSRVNGVAIRNLADVKKAVAGPQNGFHVIRFAGNDDSLILDAQAARLADPQIFATYGVDSPENLGGK
ncbi:MAG: trypsin-like peptidase domain-containing protein [Verrucomicrobiota bacterium]|nr:trypsin-like peptidase domain-containing protein [Verrucomicrobiota bacterium]